MKLNLDLVVNMADPKDRKEYFESVTTQTPMITGDLTIGTPRGAPIGTPANQTIGYLTGPTTGVSVTIRGKKKHKSSVGRKKVKKCSCGKKTK